MRRNYCRSVISLQEPLPHSLWISLDLHGILAIVWTPPYSVVSICVCWSHKLRVHNITSSPLLHRNDLLLLRCLFKVSQYRLALIDTGSVHIVKGISHHIHNIFIHAGMFSCADACTCVGLSRVRKNPPTLECRRSRIGPAHTRFMLRLAMLFTVLEFRRC